MELSVNKFYKYTFFYNRKLSSLDVVLFFYLPTSLIAYNIIINQSLLLGLVHDFGIIAYMVLFRNLSLFFLKLFQVLKGIKLYNKLFFRIFFRILYFAFIEICYFLGEIVTNIYSYILTNFGVYMQCLYSHTITLTIVTAFLYMEKQSDTQNFLSV